MILLDTGPLLAAVDRSDTHHKSCAELFRNHAEELLLPGPVVVELDYLLHRNQLMHIFTQITDEIRQGKLLLCELLPVDYGRTGELCEQYRNLDLGFVNAAIVAVAERLDVTQVATLDHRDFSIISPQHCDALNLLPAIDG